MTDVLINTYPVIYNACYGGYSYSDEFKTYLKAHPEIRNDIHNDDRTNLNFIDILLKKGSDWMSGDCAHLMIDYVPFEYGYEIEEYDGAENVVYIPKLSELAKIYNKGTFQDLIDYLSPTVVIERDNEND